MRGIDDSSKNVAVEVFKVLIERMGLDSAIDLRVESMPFEPYVQIGLFFKADMDIQDVATNRPFMKFFKEIQSKVENSPIVREQVEDLEHKLKMANLATDEMVTRVKELEKYKTHYDLAYALAQGKELIMEVRRE